MANTATIGPWSGGLNLTSNRDLSPYLDNNELGTALNVQYTREGFVECRPGFRVHPNTAINAAASGITITLLGSIFINSEQVGVIQRRTPTSIEIYYIMGDQSVMLKATFTDLTYNFTSVLALNNSVAAFSTQVPRGVFLFDNGTGADYRLVRLETTPSITAAGSPTLMDAALKVPKSDFSFAVKDRVWLVNKKTSTLYWSALDINSLWFDDKETKPAPDPPGTLTDRAIQAGYQGMDPSLDGTDDLMSCEFINNSFYLFKKQSTYMFTYQAKPEEDGYLRKISNDLGAFDSTQFRNSIVVINDRGVFSVEGTEFIDLQSKLNLVNEYYLDVVSPTAFITDFNNNILIGYVSKGTPYYFVLNSYTKGWSQWTFNYTQETIASPGSSAIFCRTKEDEGIVVFATRNKENLIYANWKPEMDFQFMPYEYNLDSNLIPDTTAGVYIRYIPPLHVYTKAQLGDSLLNFKKIYRSYIRLYLSDIPGASWTFTINYNQYKFDPAKNPMFTLVAEVGEHDTIVPHGPEQTAVADQPTALYRRTYQLPIPQQRAIEFVYEIKRSYTRMVDIRLKNSQADRTNQYGYYFQMSGIWVDYENKARI